MLQQLTIRDIVLIEQAQVPFVRGLCVLSGETGAGKSILLDALGLAIGGRAEARLVRAGKEQGSVTAEFDVGGNATIAAQLAELGIEIESDQLIIRRILSADGKSRCLVNDQSVSVTALKSLGELLVEIHGQHDQRGLLDPSSHRDLLDDFGHHAAERNVVESSFRAWRAQVTALEALREKVARAEAEEAYLRHTLGELETVKPRVGEEDELAEKRQHMMGGEKRIAAINSALAELQGSTSVASSLHAAVRMLSRSTALDAARLTAVHETLERAAEEVDEAVEELNRIAHESEFNPLELERIEERLFALRGLARKHNSTVDALAELLEATRAKLGVIENQGAELENLEMEVLKTREKYTENAQKLTKKRVTTALSLEQSVMAELSALMMGGTKIVVSVEPLIESAWQAEGMDKVTFLATTNPGSPPAPLAKIASGGELSRFMLALKVAMRDLRSTPTVIFDEIDTGTGGAVADAIGKRLAKLGETAQVLVVTHLPQVAAKGVHHLFISKKVEDGHTRTSVVPLSPDERGEELARMLSGADITDEARSAAKKLLAG